jgi:hypothetical protein
MQVGLVVVQYTLNASVQTHALFVALQMLNTGWTRCKHTGHYEHGRTTDVVSLTKLFRWASNDCPNEAGMGLHKLSQDRKRQKKDTL